ncbi:MAG: hypothetical protein RQ842_08150 [Vulcanisaeta sp.]|nr:hypothetical protein [Vulcanisaeta sp.]
MPQGLYTPIPDLVSEIAKTKAVKSLLHKKPVRSIIAKRLEGVDGEVREELGQVLIALHKPTGVDRGLFLDEHHYQRLLRYYPPSWFISTIILSRHYLGILTYRYDEPDGRFIVVGINDFKRGLFVNEFDTWVGQWLGERLLVKKDEFGVPFNIIIASDRQFMKKVFNYDEEAPDNGVLSVREGADSTAYRVQGEVVFALRRFDPEKIARDWVGGTIAGGIEYVVRELLYKTLVEGGVKVERATDNEWWVSGDDGLLRLVKRIAQVLNGHYKLTSVWVDNSEAGVGVVVSDVGVALVAKPRGDYKDGYIVRVNVDRNSVRNTPLYNEVANHVAERVRQFIGGGINNTFTMEVGLHDVTINNASRLDVTIDPKPLGVALPFSIRVYDENAFVVTERSSAVVRHIIHGEKAFKFDGEYLLWVRTTRARE